jgi:pimeloyl-ACP methyl ester carboxylesterase
LSPAPASSSNSGRGRLPERTIPAVFIHGNPETAAVWGELIPFLRRRDVITLSPPGFGAPVPSGFGATANEYLDWLADELGRMDGPIDLVGHDWGGGHVMRIAMARPELIRSWASDVAGLFDPDYVWHDMAQVWQARGAGEQSVARIAATPVDARARRYESLGMSKTVAGQVAAGFDEAMGRCMLALYRSAAQPAIARWGEDLPNAAVRPGLVLVATEDHLAGGPALARRSAARAGASVAVLQGLGHWWMCQDPERGAAALKEFWSALV